MITRRILWRETIIAYLKRVKDASKRWLSDVTHWQPVYRYTGLAMRFEITEADSDGNESDVD